MFLVRKFMAASIFYAICGLSILFFAAFFIQCCQSASRKNKHVVGELSPSDFFAPPQAMRLLAQWEQEMAEFLERQGRSTALLFLVGASWLALLGSTITCPHSDTLIAHLDQRAALMLDRSASVDFSQAGQS
jgi:hypothetical protein